MRPSFSFDRYKAFGWILHRKTLDTGDTFRVEIPQEYAPLKGHNISLWTKGRVEGVDSLTGATTEVKLPGCSILKKDIVPISDCYFTAVEPSEFWCINYTINRRQTPEVEIVCIQSGSEYCFNIDSRVLFCSGTFIIENIEHIGPKAVHFVSKQYTVKAVSDTYGFIFKKER